MHTDASLDGRGVGCDVSGTVMEQKKGEEGPDLL